MAVDSGLKGILRNRAQTARPPGGDFVEQGADQLDTCVSSNDSTSESDVNETALGSPTCGGALVLA